MRTAALFAVLVLVCVPGVTRAAQKLETASHAPSFAKNIDCPPKKVTAVAVVIAPASPVACRILGAVCVSRPVIARDDALPRSPHFVPPLPLRAPPSPLLA